MKIKTGQDVTEDVIKVFEGFRGKAYSDVAGYGTIGYGHKITKKDAYFTNEDLSEETASDLLKKDIRDHQTGALQKLKVPVTQNQMAALTSFAFNLGANHDGLEKMVGLINKGDASKAAEVFERYTKAGGNKVNALVQRRGLEKQLFLTPDGGEIDLSGYGSKKAVASSPVIAAEAITPEPKLTSEGFPAQPSLPEMRIPESLQATEISSSGSMLSRLWMRLRSLIG